MKELPPLAGLPFHLALSLTGLLSSNTAFECWKHALNDSKAPSPAPAPNDLEQLSSALQNEALARVEAFLEGLRSYLDTPYERNVAEPPAIWRQGSARLLDYGALPESNTDAHAPVVLLVPSLINRYYILDLEKNRSMARFLAASGCQVMLLDWQAPQKSEYSYDCTAYTTQVLLPCLEFIRQTACQAPVVVGYCMGGVLAVAAAQLKPQWVAGLALLATPWDFHSPDFRQALLDESGLAQLEQWISSTDLMAPEIVQTLFYLSDPWLFQEKFQRFAGLAPESRSRKEFVALEHWVNDGVALTAPAARECIVDWAQRNVLERNKWKVGGRIVRPEKVQCPSFVAAPANDAIVPPACAEALIRRLPEPTIVRPGAGHVGMVVGSKAKQQLWNPLLEWILLQRTTGKA